MNTKATGLRNPTPQGISAGDAEAVRKCNACPFPESCSEFGRCTLENPAKPACPECGGSGYVEGPGCNCGVGPSGYYGMHERYCGLEPCPNGCPFNPPSLLAAKDGDPR